MLQNGTSYFGELEFYDPETTELNLRKVDGKIFQFRAKELSLRAKLKFLATPVYWQALASQPGKLGAMVGAFLSSSLLLVLPLLIAFWASSHLFRVPSDALLHVKACAKLLLISSTVTLGWAGITTAAHWIGTNGESFRLAEVFLPGIAASVCILLAASWVLASNYRCSFGTGLGITLLSFVFASILWVSGGLFVLLLARMQKLEPWVDLLLF